MSYKYAAQTFVTIPNRYTLASVGTAAQAVYIWLCGMQDADGVCWPSIDKLAELTHTSRSTVKRACKELEAAGLIARQFSGPHAMKTANHYEVLIKDTEPVKTADGSQRTVRQSTLNHQEVPMVHTEPSDGSKPMVHTEPLTKTIVTKTKRTKTIEKNSTKVELAAKPSYGNPDINELIAYWEEVMKYPLKIAVKKNRNAINTLLKQHKTVEQVQQLVRIVAAAHADRYAPKEAGGITNYIDLQKNQLNLIVWAKKQGAKYAKQQSTIIS